MLRLRLEPPEGHMEPCALLGPPKSKGYSSTVKCPRGDNQDSQGLVTVHARMRRVKMKIAEPRQG